MKNIIKIVRIGVFVCLAGGFWLMTHLSFQSVREGIKREEAVEKCMENEGYFIVRFSDANTGLFYVISDRNDTGIEVELEGNTPLDNLSNAFRSSRNEFLVYGYEKNIEKKAADATLLEDFPTDSYTIVVEKWEIIKPIYRDYTYSSHSRMIYPKGYIDDYDMEHGDYKIIE